MKKEKSILSSERFQLTILRLCHQLLEQFPNMENTCIVGIQEKGVLLSERIHKVMTEELKIKYLKKAKLDITFYRDDFGRRKDPLKASSTEFDFLVEGMNVVLVDDVLYTGRTMHAAITALQDFGRPRKVESLCLVDRRFNRQYPLYADYLGVTVDALDKAYVRVFWKETDGEDKVELYSEKQTK